MRGAPAGVAAARAAVRMPGRTAPQRYWIQTRRLTAALLLLWFLATFVLAYFARELRFAVFGWPFSFYMGAQGSLLIYLLIVFVYAQRQRRRDLAFGVGEPDGD